MISAGNRWPLYDTSPTLIPLRRIDSEIIHFGRTNHEPDNAPMRLAFLGAFPVRKFAFGRADTWFRVDRG